MNWLGQRYGRRSSSEMGAIVVRAGVWSLILSWVLIVGWSGHGPVGLVLPAWLMLVSQIGWYSVLARRMTVPIVSMTPILLIFALVLVGCSPVKVGEPGQTAWLWTSPTSGELLVRTCPQFTSGDECSKLPRVEFTTNSQDREAWQFEARVKLRAVSGVPYGRMPTDIIVVGSQARCEEIRSTRALATGDPTESCQGPLYFRSCRENACPGTRHSGRRGRQ
jgi:hypothetical protein